MHGKGMKGVFQVLLGMVMNVVTFLNEVLVG